MSSMQSSLYSCLKINRAKIIPENTHHFAGNQAIARTPHWLRHVLLLGLAAVLVACGGGGGGSSSSSSSAPAASTYSIAGAISGPAPAGITVTLSGFSSTQTTTAADGSFSFAGLPNGSYTAAPVAVGYAFSPKSATVTISNAGVSAVTFTQTAVYGATGTVTGAPAGVVLTLSGDAAATAISSANGSYSYAALASGNYTVTPSLTGYSFSPASATFSVASGAASAPGFTATQIATTYSYFSDNTAIYALDRSHANSTPVKVATLVTPPAANSTLQSLSLFRADVLTDANQRLDLIYIDNGRLYRLPGSSVGIPAPVQISNLSNMTWSCGKPTPITSGLSDAHTQLAFNLPTQAGGCSDSTVYLVTMAMTATDSPLTQTATEARALPMFSATGIVGYLSVVNNQLVQTDSVHNNPVVVADNVTAVARNFYSVDTSLPAFSSDTFIDITTPTTASELYHYDPVSKTLGQALGPNIKLQVQRGNILYAFAENPQATSATLITLPVNGQQLPQNLPCTSFSFTGTPQLFAGTAAGDSLVVVADNNVYRLADPANTCALTTLSSTMSTASFSFGAAGRFVFSDVVGGIDILHDVSLASTANDITRTHAFLSGFNLVGEANPPAWNQEVTHALIMANLDSLPNPSFQELDYKTGNSTVLGHALSLPTGSYPVYFESYDEGGSVNGAAIVPVFDSSNSLANFQLYTYVSGSANSMQLVKTANKLYWLNMYRHNLN
jgi:hypothetical protein